jgi:hypothetical protein
MSFSVSVMTHLLTAILFWFIGAFSMWSSFNDAVKSGSIILGNQLYACEVATAMPRARER